MRKSILIRSLPIAVVAVGLVAIALRARSTAALPRYVQLAKDNHVPVDRKLIDADNAFGFRLFGILAKGAAGNTLFSPISAALALQMAYNGASGQTEQAMEKALNLPGMTPDKVSSANAALLAGLDQIDPQIKLHIANSLWCGKGGMLPVQPGFVKRSQDYYGATVGDLTGAPDTINDWVRTKTDGKIDSIISQSDLDGVVAVLVNAVYFKGQWANKFDTSLTRDETFTTLDGRSKSVKMMHQSGHYDYYRGDGFQAVRLPYGAGRLGAYLFLPDENTKFSDFLTRLTAENWNRWRSQFQSAEGDIGLPHFRFDYAADLVPPLKELGMEVAFEPGSADFSNLAGRPGDVWISSVRQKTYVDVNEEGTEAAAATDVVVAANAIAIPASHFQLVLDRPFVCILQDQATGAILFLGAITNPE